MWTWVNRYQNVSDSGFIGAKDDEVGVDNWIYKTCKAQSNHHHRQTNTQPFTGRVSFLKVKR